MTRLDTAPFSDFTFDPAALTQALGTDEWNAAVEIEQNAVHFSISLASLSYRRRSTVDACNLRLICARLHP